MFCANTHYSIIACFNALLALSNCTWYFYHFYPRVVLSLPNQQYKQQESEMSKHTKKLKSDDFLLDSLYKKLGVPLRFKVNPKGGR